MSFDIRQLRYAIADADHGSFYRAARALEVEQSTLSRNISKLERSIGMSIFERSRAGVTMTLAGSAFIRGVRTIVVGADKLIAMMQAAGQGRAGGLVVGHNSSVSAGNLRATLMSWGDAHPDVELEFVEADRSVLLAGLDRGEVDIAVLIGTVSHADFLCEPFWSERMLGRTAGIASSRGARRGPLDGSSRRTVPVARHRSRPGNTRHAAGSFGGLWRQARHPNATGQPRDSS